MNILQKLSYRIFQESFHLVIPFLPYREPEILDSCTDLSKVFKKENISSLLIVTDKGIENNGLLKPVEDICKLCNINYVIYDGLKPNPTVKNVESGLELFKKNKSQAIIAIGGGSAIDSAKAIGARAVNPKRDLSKMKGILKVWHKLPPLIAIPTTAGTGSEVTLAAVITDEVTHNKYAIMDFPLIPKYAVLDPKMTYTLPKSLTASTGMDALTHAIVGYIHAIAHSLGGFYDIPHGLANAVVMPIVLESYGSSIHKKMHDIAIAAGVSSQDDSDEDACNKMIQSIRKLNQEMNIPSHIREIRTEDIPKLAHHATKEANPLYPVPMIYDDDKLAALYKLVKGDIEYGTNENMQYAKRVFFKW